MVVQPRCCARVGRCQSYEAQIPNGVCASLRYGGARADVDATELNLLGRWSLPFYRFAGRCNIASKRAA